MNQLAITYSDSFDDAAVFFDPVDADLIDRLIEQRNADKAKILAVATFMSETHNEGTMTYFFEGNKSERAALYWNRSLFDTEGAIKALDAEYWQKIINQTDIIESMPNKDREEWREGIVEHKTAPFDDSSVRTTIASLLSQRPRYLADRVDGIFKSLSGNHVTNQPQGFGKRMIIEHMFDGWGYPNSCKSGYVSDLRQIIDKFIGRETKKGVYCSTLLSYIREDYGVWHEVDGGSLRMKAFKKGTLHIEIHPDIAWRLNKILALLYPMAIPSSFRRKPAKPNKTYSVISTPLPFEVLHEFHDMRIKEEGRVVETRLQSHSNRSKGGTADRVITIIKSLGGVQKDKLFWIFEFDYDFGPVRDQIMMSGCIPEYKSHQYYPSPEYLARRAVISAEIEEHHQCLEPSAGTGGIAKYLPSNNTTCVEISPLYSHVLKSKGYNTVEADFLIWSQRTCERFDRIVMNPPFSAGRAIRHLEAAASLLNANGIVVAILPSSMKDKVILEGFTHQWTEVFFDEFENATVNTVILIAKKT